MKRNGFSVIEVVLGIFLTGVLISAVAGFGGRLIAGARQAEALAEMAAIADAAVSYRSVNGVWPSEMSALSGYLTGAADRDPWGGTYTLSPAKQSISVACFFPGAFNASAGAGVLMEMAPSGAGNIVRITRPLSYGRAGRLMTGGVNDTSK